jgi:hypothetical protein
MATGPGENDGFELASSISNISSKIVSSDAKKKTKRNEKKKQKSTFLVEILATASSF